jgi:hypothetical protein
MLFGRTRLVAFRRLVPRRARLVVPFAFSSATPVRVIHRVHRRSAHLRPKPPVPPSSGISNGQIFMFGVAHLPDRRHAGVRHHANFAGRHLERGKPILFRHDANFRSRRSRHLRAVARHQLHRVDHGPERDVD